MRSNRELTRVTTWLASMLAGLIALAFPLGFFIQSYQSHIASMQVEADFGAISLSQMISANPELWQFEELRLGEKLKDLTAENLPEQRRVVDANGVVIAQSSALLKTPEVIRTAELFDSGSVVGRFEVVRSLRPLLLQTAWVSLFSCFIGGMVLLILRVYPLRALKTALGTLADEKDRAEVTLHSIGDAVITTDASGCIDYLNPVTEQITGWTIDAALGLPAPQVFNIVDESTGEPLDSPVHKAISQNRIVPLASQTALITRDGSSVPIEDSAAPIRDRMGKIVGAILVFHDVSHARAMATKLSHQASHDALTGLANRPAFESHLQKVLANAQWDNSHHTLCYMDLDQFKIINDTCGHMAGDAMLQQVAVALRAKVRNTDCLARLGGDEFGLLLEGCTLDRAERIAETVLQTVKDLRFTWQGQTFAVGVSIGLVGINADCGDLATIMSAADSACYAAKDRGRNCIYVYLPNDSEVAQRRGQMQWVARITHAMDEGRFRLYYQTILPLAAGRAGAHYEILLRMLGEDGEIISPAAFIPAAERYGLMPAIDRWVIENTFARLDAIYGDRIQDLLHTCSVNLSGTSWGHDDLGAFICEAAARHNVPASVICFEITETAAITNLAKTISFIRKLRGFGFRFSLDDFGSGVSSFGYLKQIPVDYLKIDGGFVRNMIDDKIDYAMVETINRIGHIMGIRTIAEFVENEVILEKIIAMGVDNAQGYAIARPQPLDQITGAMVRTPASPTLSS